MSYTRVKPKSERISRPTGAYADLDELVRLQFKASGFSFLPRQPLHSVLSGRHASRLRGRGLNFEELRPYRPGDDIRSVDWKTTARASKAHVRVYTEERDRPVWLLVNQRQSMFFGSRISMKSVTAAEAAAVGAWRVLAAGDRVGALIFDDTDIVQITPHRSQKQVMQILGAILEKNHRLHANSTIPANPEILNIALRQLLPLAKHDCLICLIGDGSGITDETPKLITQLNAHNDLLALFVYDPLEKQLPKAGWLSIADGEQRMGFQSDDTQLGQRFEEDFQARLQKMEELSRQSTMPLLPISTARPVIDQVRDLLGKIVRPRRI